MNASALTVPGAQPGSAVQDHGFESLAGSGALGRAFRPQSNSVEASAAATYVMAALMTGDPQAIRAKGTIEVDIHRPLCERVEHAIHHALQSTGVYLDNLRVRKGEANGNVVLSWTGGSHSSHFG